MIQVPPPFSTGASSIFIKVPRAASADEALAGLAVVADDARAVDAGHVRGVLLALLEALQTSAVTGVCSSSARTPGTPHRSPCSPSRPDVQFE